MSMMLFSLRKKSAFRMIAGAEFYAVSQVENGQTVWYCKDTEGDPQKGDDPLKIAVLESAEREVNQGC